MTMENVPAAQAIGLLMHIFCVLLFTSQVATSSVINPPPPTWSTPSPVPTSELHALFELKVRLSNNSDAQLPGWNANNSQNICKSWTGVSCSYVSGQSHIATINLPGSGLEGSLPPELGNLSFLLTLNLSANRLMGGIPAELSQCSSLQVLNLTSNSLTGPIPPSLSSLSDLQDLLLCNNSLSGQIPPTLFTNCTSLVKLGLCLNSLTGSIPAEVHLPSLQWLLLWGNHLTGHVPRSLGNCSSLVVLELSSNKLSGAIPSEIGFLAQLQSLFLDENRLTGAIPPSLSSLSDLQVLRLFNNSLSGRIPPTLFTNCTSLVILGLCLNSLTGSIPTEVHLPRLQVLLLWENHLTGSIPRSLGNCSSLVSLQLHSNKLSGPIPGELGFLTQLQILFLHQNRLAGAIPSTLGMCNNLLVLILAENELTGGIPTELGALTTLTVLELQSNNLTGAIPRSLGNCTSLIELSLESNKLSGSIPTELGMLAHLQIVLLWGNKLNGSIPGSTLGNCTDLLRLDLAINRLTGFIPSELMKLKHLQYLLIDQNHLLGFERPGEGFRNATSLIQLSVGGNQLTGSISVELAHSLKGLQFLNLAVNQLSGNIPWDSLSNCSSLYHLDLSHNHLAGGLWSESGRLLNLQVLDLNSNFLQGTIPDLGGLISLESVRLSFNQLNGTLPNNLAQVVHALDFSHNNLSGILPPWLVQLPMVEVIDLSQNHLTGTVPNILGGCMALTNLNLSNNNLLGEFPWSFGNNSYLSSLDLSNNELTGVLPSTLQYLKHLHFLNISFNNFMGPIPRFGVFEHLDASCFDGNPGLCGPIIHKLCGVPHHHVHLGWKIRVLLALLAAMVPTGIVLVAFYSRYRCSKRQLAMVDLEAKSLIQVRHFSARCLCESTQGYSEENLLGRGSVGVVYKGILPNGEVVAVKKFRDDIASSREALLQEVNILSKLRHRNLVKVLGCVLNLEVNALVLEFMSNGSLERYLCQVANKEKLDRLLSWAMVLRVAQGVANALTHLHHEHDAMPIIHGDLKPSNILLDSELEAHLSDFGLAKLAKSNSGAVSLTSNFKGSIGYMAPEYALATKVTTKVDVFSFGVVMLEMMSGRGPMHELLHGVTLHEWVKQKLLSHDLCEILHASLLQSSSSDMELHNSTIWQILQMAVACTEELPSRRPTMQQVKAFIDSNLVLGASVEVGSGA